MFENEPSARKRRRRRESSDLVAARGQLGKTNIHYACCSTDYGGEWSGWHVRLKGKTEKKEGAVRELSNSPRRTPPR